MCGIIKVVKISNVHKSWGYSHKQSRAAESHFKVIFSIFALKKNDILNKYKTSCIKLMKPWQGFYI